MLVVEGDRFQREDGFARFVHWLDLILETCRGRRHAKLTTAVYVNYRACNCSTNNPGDKGSRLGLLIADANCVGLARNTAVADINIVSARGELVARIRAECDVEVAGGVTRE